MKITRKAIAGNDFVLLGVGADLVCIHANHGDFNGSSKVEIVVAQMIGGCLEVILVHFRRIVDYFVKNWLSCCNGGLVRDQIEVV